MAKPERFFVPGSHTQKTTFDLACGHDVVYRILFAITLATQVLLQFGDAWRNGM